MQRIGALVGGTTGCVAGAVTAALALWPAPAGAHGPVASAARRLPTVLTGYYGRYEVRPSSIYDTGDGSGVIGVLRRNFTLKGPGRGSLHWHSWTRKRATASGSYWLKLGTPTATSPWTREPLSLTLTRVRSGHFTRMNMHYRQSGRRANVTLCVPDHRKVSMWGQMIHGSCI